MFDQIRFYAFLCAMFLLAGPVHPWEADGFRSGDSVQRIEGELASWGVSGRPKIEHGHMRNAYSLGTPGRWFVFCNDRLFGYDRSSSVTVSSFALLLQMEINRRGAPTVNGEQQVRVGERGVWFVWSTTEEEFVLILSQDEKGKVEAVKRYEDLRVKAPCNR